MTRKILSLGLLAIIILWLVMSYAPTSLVDLPRFSLLDWRYGAFFQTLAVSALALFVTIQLLLVWFTVGWFRSPSPEQQLQLRLFGLRLWPEFIWTALPVLMTLGLALASYQAWVGSPAP